MTQASVRQQISPLRPNIALGGRAGEGILGRRDDQRALAHDVGQGVDFQRLVDDRIHKARLERDLGPRISDGENE